MKHCPAERRSEGLSVPAGSISAMETETTPTSGEPAEAGLTEQDLEMLELEKTWWKYAGAKETLVRERFGISSTRFYQRLNWIIDQPEALAAEPMLVRRLLRLREARARQRSAAGIFQI